MSTKELNALYKKGLSDERHIISVLRNIGCTVLESTDKEDYEEDIDCYVQGLTNEDNYAWATSIKCDGVASKNLVFEMEGYSKRTQQWYPSWYYKGQAQYYVVWKKTTNIIYLVNSPLLNEYVKQHDFERITRISEATRKLEQSHNQIDTLVGLIKISTLIAKGIATVLLENVPTENN